MHVIVCHGRGSSPDGRKAVALAGVARERPACTVEVPDLRSYDDQEPVARRDAVVQRVLRARRPVVLVGSSAGAWAAAAASAVVPVHGLYLMATALGRTGAALYPDVQPQAVLTRAVHGSLDAVVPVERAHRWADRHHQVDLAVVADDHRLHGVVEFLQRDFQAFLTACAEVWAVGQGATF